MINVIVKIINFGLVTVPMDSFGMEFAKQYAESFGIEHGEPVARIEQI